MRTHRKRFIPGKHRFLFTLCLLFLLFTVVMASLPAQPVMASEPSADPSQEREFQALLSGKKVQQNKEYLTPENPTVYLTFDDGPSKLTGKVLDLLKEEGVKATFFVLGEAAEAHPELIKRMAEEGHSIGNHTYNHVYKELYRDFHSFWEQVQYAQRVIHDITGITTELLRAPGGTATNFDPFYFYYLEQAGYKVHDWNVDSKDSSGRNVPAAKILQTVKSTPLKHEMNVLLHDGAGKASTLEALPDIIRHFKNHGYSFAPLTPDVKPIQFQIAKSKWTRTASLEYFKETQKEVRQYASSRLHRNDRIGTDSVDQELKLVHQTEVVQEEAAEALAEWNAVPLMIKLGSGQWTLHNDQYEWRQDRIQVPLRALIERMGGEVRWNDERKTATAHYGLYDIEYDLTTYSMRVYTLGQETAVYPMADMKLESGSVRVPLAGTLEQLGSRLTILTGDERGREVSIGLGSGMYLKDHMRIAPDSLFAQMSLLSQNARKKAGA